MNMDELPKAFVSSLRVLFEILDEDSDGFVELREIEKRWQGDSVTGLPAGVVDSLRGIAPKDGRLSFDRFCTGLKITLEKNRSTSKGRQVQVRGSRSSREDKQPTTATVRPNNIVHPMRAKSVPQLQDVTANKTRQIRNSRSSTSIADDKRKSNPPDYASHLQKSKDKRRSSEKDNDYDKYQSRNDVFEPSTADKQRVEATLKSWQQEKKLSENHHQRKHDLISERKQDEATFAKPPQMFGGDIKLKPPSESLHEKTARRTSENAQKGGGGVAGRRRKEEPRRHTLSNGIDYSMLKRMKQLEQERDTFLHGLEALELAKDWYRQQLADLKERQDRINKAQADFTEDLNHQDMVAYRTTRITEVNRQLRILIATPEKGFPNHMNLAINRHRQTGASSPLLVDKLKQQNRLLTEEVSSRSERISELEQEKAALIRQLFEARGRQRELPDNTTFL